MSVKAQMYALLESLDERAPTPVGVKHCVAKVAPKYGGDTSRAFAICVAQMQKSGQLKPGTMQATAKGKKAHKGEKGSGTKLKKYEKLLKKAREK